MRPFRNAVSICPLSRPARLARVNLRVRQSLRSSRSHRSCKSPFFLCQLLCRHTRTISLLT
jgi:hypothetical protein